MSALFRILHPLPAARRSYSSFFSSKPGGGRFFNSSKPPKSPVVGAKKSESLSKDTTTTAANQDGATNGSQTPRNAAEAHASSSSSSLSSVIPETDSAQRASESNNPFSDFAEFQKSLHLHPVMNAKDFKLHQFFSLHRPLLLIHNPSSIFHTPPGTGSILSDSLPQAVGDPHSRTASVFDDYLGDTSIDADAEAARQLTRALTMSQAGARVAWESTLKHLGLDLSQEPERIDIQQQMDKDWEDVHILLDSTKRKRRKKMKKHKLKKRRKETRSSRLKLK